IADKRTVSRIINSARYAIVKSFVSDNLGFGHVTREDVIDGVGGKRRKGKRRKGKRRKGKRRKGKRSKGKRRND
ncbi:unnamed protein product, partial [Rotaria magnacalcarata]